jgi:hypothetical protein
MAVTWGRCVIVIVLRRRSGGRHSGGDKSSAQRVILLPKVTLHTAIGTAFRAVVSLTACGWCAKPHTNSPMVRGLHKTRCRDQTQPKLTGVVHDFWSTRRETNGTGRKGVPAVDEMGN